VAVVSLPSLEWPEAARRADSEFVEELLTDSMLVAGQSGPPVCCNCIPSSLPLSTWLQAWLPVTLIVGVVAQTQAQP
jgi:hypothetical protein